MTVALAIDADVVLEPRPVATDLRSTHAIDVAYRDFGAALFRFAFRSLGDRGHAEEAVQETFMRAWRAADHYDEGRGPLRAWLFSICRNVVIDMTRARKIRPAVGHGVDAAASETDAGVDAIDELLQAAALEEALRMVGSEHRQVLTEVLILDRPQDVVAAASLSRRWVGVTTRCDEQVDDFVDLSTARQVSRRVETSPPAAHGGRQCGCG
jgi:RNA polymerase sigma-70 factor, ECF subfamily